MDVQHQRPFTNGQYIRILKVRTSESLKLVINTASRNISTHTCTSGVDQDGVIYTVYVCVKVSK